MLDSVLSPIEWTILQGILAMIGAFLYQFTAEPDTPGLMGGVIFIGLFGFFKLTLKMMIGGLLLLW